MRRKKGNKYEIRGDVAAILIERRNGEIIEAIIDTVNLPLVENHTWRVIHYQNLGTFYVATWVRIENGKYKSVRLHRLILGAPEDLHVDHLNHNPLDNRRCNLRLVTKAENNQNRRTPKNNTSGERNVRWNSEMGKWTVAMSVNKKEMYFGLFEDKNEAIQIARQKRREYFPFAN